jgi:hypothetical protein
MNAASSLPKRRGVEQTVAYAAARGPTRPHSRPSPTPDSPGGNLYAGLELGASFRRNNWNTVVGLEYPVNGTTTVAVCASACVYAFVGGVRRVVMRDNVLAVHQFAVGGPTRITVGDVQRLTAMIDVYLTKMGVSSLLQTVAGLTAAQSITTLTIRDAMQLGVATNG